MKKLMLVIMLFLYGMANAQNYVHLNITEIQHGDVLEFCVSECNGVVIEKELGCEDWLWHVQIINGDSYDYYTDEITLIPLLTSYYHVRYMSNCGIPLKEFDVKFMEFQGNEPFVQDYMWKRPDESVTLWAGGDGYQCQWSTGSTEYGITVTQPGIYWVRVYNNCGELYDTIQVRDNVEIELATCDLETNLNIVTWPTTPAQAGYVDQVVIKRDGIQVGTANYADGYFLDNIGSDAASRTYTATAIGTDGVLCPIESYPKETIHMAYLTGINNTIEVNWNAPTGYDLLGYNICEWHQGAKDGDLTVIDYVGAGVTSYTCSESMFDQGNVVVQGVEAGKSRTESRLLSNRSWETVGIGEHQSNSFSVYPNPTNGTFTVQGAKTLTIYNTMGQVVARSDNNEGKHTLSLAPGVYFIKSDEGTQKVVVE